jgi:hypothetical protein
MYNLHYGGKLATKNGYLKNINDRVTTVNVALWVCCFFLEYTLEGVSII